MLSPMLLLFGHQNQFLALNKSKDLGQFYIYRQSFYYYKNAGKALYLNFHKLLTVYKQLAIYLCSVLSFKAIRNIRELLPYLLRSK